MAINNWRQVVTWGYMDPNGNIVEETQWVPNTTHSPDHILNQVNSILDWTKTPAQVRVEDNIYWTPTADSTNTNSWPSVSNMFTPQETYQYRSEWYYNQGDTTLWDAWKSLADWMGKYSSEANSTLSGYNSLLNFIKNNEEWLQWTTWKVYDKLVSWIQSDYDYANRMFWPEGELTKEVNQYYDDLWNYLASDAGRQAATIAAQWIHTWASLGSIRAQQNEAYNQSFQRYVQAKEQQINAKQQLASNLLNFMSTLRKEYWDTTNDYIIEMYKRAADLYEKTAMSALADLNAFNNMNATASWSWWWGSSSTWSSILDSILDDMKTKQTLLDAWYTEEQADKLIADAKKTDNKDWTVTKSQSEIDEAKKKLNQEQPKKTNKSTSNSKTPTAEEIWQWLWVLWKVSNPVYWAQKWAWALTRWIANLLRGE